MRKFACTILAVVACAAVAQPAPQAPPRYRITNLSSLGGTTSKGNSVNDFGLVLGYSRQADNNSAHAAAWLFGQLFDLNTLGGLNSSVAWPVKNVVGVIAGISQTAAVQPLGESWSCSAFFPAATATGSVCRGFVWEWGRMRELPTLGGDNGFAAGANNLGQITGWAETPLHDPSCEGPGAGKSGQQLQFLPVIYGPGPDEVHALPLIPGDSSGAATAINDHGQAVGISGECDQAQGRKTAIHPVLWENSQVTDLGNGKLKAAWWNTATAINQHGVVVGFLGDPRDSTGNITHAFIWTRENGIRRLVPGDYGAGDTDNSAAYGINERGQVVGSYIAADGSSHGFLWESGMLTLTDLNDLKLPGYADTLQQATDINDQGQITGRAVDSVSGERPAFLASPIPAHR